MFALIKSIFAVTPGKLQSMIGYLEEINTQWMKTRNICEYEGIYSGVLFSKASTVCSTQFLFTDYIHFCENSIRSIKDENESVWLSAVLRMGGYLAEQYNPEISIKSYDKNKYLTMDIILQNDVFMTVSVDNTKGKNEKRIVLSHRENGRYFFHDIRIQADQTKAVLTSDLYSSPDSVFPENEDYALLVSEQLSLTNGEVKETFFRYKCLDGDQKRLISSDGKMENDCMEGKIYLLEEEKEWAVISSAVHKNSREPIPESKKTLKSGREEDCAEFQIALFSGLTVIVSEIIPVLPMKLQKMLMEYIFTQ